MDALNDNGNTLMKNVYNPTKWNEKGNELASINICIILYSLVMIIMIIRLLFILEDSFLSIIYIVIIAIFILLYIPLIYGINIGIRTKENNPIIFTNGIQDYNLRYFRFPIKKLIPFKNINVVCLELSNDNKNKLIKYLTHNLVIEESLNKDEKRKRIEDNIKSFDGNYIYIVMKNGDYIKWVKILIDDINQLTTIFKDKGIKIYT